MRLADLDPEWLAIGGPDIRDVATGEEVPRIEKAGLSFLCPCGCGHRVMVMFQHSVGENKPIGERRYSGHRWQATGNSFDDLTLRPSILRSNGCGFHGYITNGEVQTL